MSLFLDASTHLYEKAGPLVGPSNRPSRVIFMAEKPWLIIRHYHNHHISLQEGLSVSLFVRWSIGPAVFILKKKNWPIQDPA